MSLLNVLSSFIPEGERIVTIEDAVELQLQQEHVVRLETLVLMAGMDLPLRAIREQIAAAVDVVVQLTRLRDGTRRVTHVTEVQGMEGETVTLQDAFLFDYAAGVDAAGRFLGAPVPTGVRPRFTDRFDELGITLSPRVFGVAEPARGRSWA